MEIRVCGARSHAGTSAKSCRDYAGHRGGHSWDRAYSLPFSSDDLCKTLDVLVDAWRDPKRRHKRHDIGVRMMVFSMLLAQRIEAQQF